jgi:hypothetical protein
MDRVIIENVQGVIRSCHSTTGDANLAHGAGEFRRANWRSYDKGPGRFRKAISGCSYRFSSA